MLIFMVWLLFQRKNGDPNRILFLAYSLSSSSLPFLLLLTLELRITRRRRRRRSVGSKSCTIIHFLLPIYIWYRLRMGRRASEIFAHSQRFLSQLPVLTVTNFPFCRLLLLSFSFSHFPLSHFLAKSWRDFLSWANRWKGWRQLRRLLQTEAVVAAWAVGHRLTGSRLGSDYL